MILDVFSRYVVGWTVQYRENAQLAKALIEQADRAAADHPQDPDAARRPRRAAARQAGRFPARRPRHHEDTFSRPYTSSDNPYSEANFKTLKYRPEFPARFDDIEHARAHCRAFFDWYNHAHRHSGIGLMTPAAVHHGQRPQLHAARAHVLDAAYERNPDGSSASHPSRPTTDRRVDQQARRRSPPLTKFEREASHRA